MARQSSGLGLVIVVLLAAVMVPAIAGREIAGNAMALSIPAAPHVGDCLLGVALDPVSGAAADPAPRSVPCSSAHDGEVIIQTATVTTGDSTSKVGGGDVPDVAACADTAYWYLGVHPLDAAGERSALLGPWWPAFSADFEALIPSPLQLRIGQSWAACVMTSPHGLIIGSAAHLFGEPPRASPIALCTPRREILLEVAVSCTDPHTTEVLGWRVAAEGTIQTTFVQSCAELARRITGMTDPTAGGALIIAVDLIRGTDGVVRQGWGPGHGGEHQAACTISTASARLLAGSLMGLGNASVPWE
jgi:hypothetical protein